MERFELLNRASVEFVVHDALDLRSCSELVALAEVVVLLEDKEVRLIFAIMKAVRDVRRLCFSERETYETLNTFPVLRPFFSCARIISQRRYGLQT